MKPDGSDIVIRRARPDDLPALTESLRVHARLQGLEDGELTAHALGDALFRPRPLIEALIAHQHGVTEREAVVGHVLFHDTWDAPFATPGVMITDLHVRFTRRRTGLGRALMEAVNATARERDATFVCWIAMPENPEALAFYKSVGATTRPAVAHSLSID